MKSTTRTVRRGRRFSFFISRSASHVTMHPPPSSVEPVPTSQESKWPPTTTTSSGRSRPRISPTTLAESASGRNFASIFRRSADLRAAVLHALQALGVLDRDGGRGNLRHAVGVAQRAGVRRAQAGRADGADEHGDGAERCRPRRAGGAVLDGFAVGRERDVEEHDLAANAWARGVELGKRTTTSTRLRRRRRACRRCCRGRASPARIDAAR